MPWNLPAETQCGSVLLSRLASQGTCIPVDDGLVLLGLLDELVEGLEVVVDVVGPLEEVVAVGLVLVGGGGRRGVARGQVVLVGDGGPLRRAGRVAAVGVLQLLEDGATVNTEVIWRSRLSTT